MPSLELVSDNVPANESGIDLLQTTRLRQIEQRYRAVRITVYGIASALGLALALWIDGENAYINSPVSVSATPNRIVTDEDGLITDIGATRGQQVQLLLTETTGVATSDFRGRIVYQPL